MLNPETGKGWSVRMPKSTRESLVELAVGFKRRVRPRTRLLQLWARLRRMPSALDHYHYRLRRAGYGLEALRNLYWDWRFGGYCGGSIRPPEYESLGANAVESSEYYLLDMVFDGTKLQISPSDVLVDVGCGKGRVINYWLRRGCKNKIIGIELNEDVAGAAAERLKAYTNVTIIAGSATACVPTDGTLFYVYNPFRKELVQQFAQRLFEGVDKKDKLRVVYINCVHIDVFENDPRWKVEYLDVGWRRIRAALVTCQRAGAVDGASEAGGR
jgi:hypothetical protein